MLLAWASGNGAETPKRIFLFICHISILGQEGSFSLLLLFWHHPGLHHNLGLFLNEGSNGLYLVWEVVEGERGTTRLYVRKNKLAKPLVHPGSIWSKGHGICRLLRALGFKGGANGKGKERPCGPGSRCCICLQWEQPCFYLFYALKFRCFQKKRLKSTALQLYKIKPPNIQPSPLNPET